MFMLSSSDAAEVDTFVEGVLPSSSMFSAISGIIAAFGAFFFAELNYLVGIIQYAAIFVYEHELYFKAHGGLYARHSIGRPLIRCFYCFWLSGWVCGVRLGPEWNESVCWLESPVAFYAGNHRKLHRLIYKSAPFWTEQVIRSLSECSPNCLVFE